MTRPHAHSIPHALLLALLLAVPTALASGMPPAAPPQTSAANPSQPTFTDAEWAKLEMIWKKNARDVQIDSDVTQVLGLTKPGETMIFRELAGADDADTKATYPHFFVHIPSRPDLLFFAFLDRKTPQRQVAYGYLVDKNLHLISSYISTGTPIALSQQQGEAGLAAEIRWWAYQLDDTPNP